VVDNRPGFAIKTVSGAAKAVSPSGSETAAQDTLSLTLESIFDLTQSDNILYKFNSINGGVVVPRGTSLVGLDLRKTKIRPKYVPNPTDSDVAQSAIFRVTGACYFWQFSIFDGREDGVVYTDPVDFSANNQSKPTFSHHKLTCFEYADGVNIPSGYDLTDLQMYYSKLSNAFNLASGRDVDQKYPDQPLGFYPQRPEWEIVGAFAADPISISSIISGDGFTPSSVITVTTTTEHGLTADTPIKIKGVSEADYNVSGKVQAVLSATQFTYAIPFVRANLPASPSVSSATVTIETDTVSGASPYIFNISLRSVYGMQGMHADGSKASGFRSMVVAQFTAVSLQKDDRAFVKYNQSSRAYDSIAITKQTGSALSTQSSSTNPNTVYHLDPNAIYRSGWEISHIKMSNDAFVQIVSVFAIGFTFHFDVRTGGDASITNSNSNFGQHSLHSEGFRKEAFNKDTYGYITNIISPRAITSSEEQIDWISIDVGLTTQIGISSHLYLFGYDNADVPPPAITQGYRIGSKLDDQLHVVAGAGTSLAPIRMTNNVVGSGSTIAYGTVTSEKSYKVSGGPSSNILTIGNHNIQTGETIRILSDSGDLPENLTTNTIYYAIKVSSSEIKVSSTKANAENNLPITIYGGDQLRVESRVSDKVPGDIGHPMQWDTSYSNWFIVSDQNNEVYRVLKSQGVAGIGVRTNDAYVVRTDDERSLDEKIFKIRYVVPKDVPSAKEPLEGYILQETSTTGARSNSDFTLTSITSSDYDYNRNPRFISTCTVVSSTVTVIADIPHHLNIGDHVNIKNVTSTTNTSGTNNIGFNGTFEVTAIPNANTFSYDSTDVDGVTHNLGTFTNNTHVRSTDLPRFERNDLRKNLYIYRRELITPYIYGVQDGIYHLYVTNSNNSITTEFTNYKYSQQIEDLYPQLDKDNYNDSPSSAVSFAKRSPVGEVVTNDLKRSITRESIDISLKSFGAGLEVTGITTSSGISTITFDREHGFSGIVTYSSFAGGNGYNDGTFYNVKLFNDGTSTWDGATAKVVISSGTIQAVDITSGGSGYTNNEQLDFDTSTIGVGAGAGLTITTSGISTNIGDVVQITGIGTTSDGYYRISSVPAKNQIAIAHTGGDPLVVVGSYALPLGPSVKVSSITTYDSVTGLATVTCSGAHGLFSGNRFRFIDSNRNKLGDYLVKERVGVNTFTIHTSASVGSPDYILRHGISANDAISDSSNENLAIRSIPLYGNDYLTLSGDISAAHSSIPVSLPASGIGTVARFPLGSFIQVGAEIMRITSSTLSGSGGNEISVIRGALGTVISDHSAGSLIKKIKPIPTEVRRPAIARASGHTFEYLGFGPGNYSTGLPQVQVKSLNEREVFLAQSQEKSGGVIVYTGMNNDGEFYIGNKRVSSATGQERTFDAPIPTTTGQETSILSAVFDEVIIKERLKVEGGNSGTVLSQFDGPVTFNKETKFNDVLNLNNNLRVSGHVEVTNTTDSSSKDTGALIVDGGVGIEKNLYVGSGTSISKDLYVAGNAEIVGVTTTRSLVKLQGTTGNTLGNVDTGTLQVDGGTGIAENLTVGGATSITGNLHVKGNIVVEGTGLFPIGAIILWYGSVAAIPVGWSLCNGQTVGAYTTPDLRERFVVGAGGDNSTVSGGGYSVGDTGGATSVTLTTSEMPAHSHTVTDSGHSHGSTVRNNFLVGNGDYGSDPRIGADNKTYSFQFAGSTSSATTGISIANAGSGSAHENRPPYYALCYIMRTS
jgi:microcystin-dependent protein